MSLTVMLVAISFLSLISKETADYVVRYLSVDHSEKTQGGALKTLRQRYANGEITKKEYEIMKNDLE